MNKTLKWIFAGLSLLIVGGLIFVLGMTGLKWDFYKLDTETYTEKTYAASADAGITRVELGLKSFPLTVRTGDEPGLKYYETESSKVTVTEVDGVLKITENYEYNFFTRGMFQLGRIKHPFVLTMPDGADISVSGANADIMLNGIACASISLCVANLDVEMTGCSLGTVNIDSYNTDVEMYGGTTKTLEIVSTNLDVYLSDANVGVMTAKSINGELEVERSKCESIVFECTNGDVDIDFSECGNIKLDAVNTDCSLYRVAADTLYISGTNLDADILLLGDSREYTVETHGHHLPPQQTGSGDKKIYLRGTNCDVSLRFVG